MNFGGNPCPDLSIYDELPFNLVLELFYEDMELNGNEYEFIGKYTLQRAVFKRVTPLNPVFFPYLKE